MNEDYFINIAFDKALKLYIKSRDDKESVTYNSFLVVVIRLLVLIYGEADLLNPYYLGNKVVFLNNLSKYGMSNSDVALFKEELLSYYNFEIANNKDTIKVKNPYFKTILKYLTDMFVLKKKSTSVSYEDEETFLELVYTTHTKNPYRVSFSYLMNEDPTFIEKYYYSKLNELDVTKDLSKTINMNLNLEALNYVGVNLSNLNNLSEKDLITAKDATYNYFSVDADSPMRDQELQDKLVSLKEVKYPKLTSGNGYVDILLLMSIIVTSFSVISIIFFAYF